MAIELLHQPGETIAQRYRILATLGQGGIGITYQALDLQENHRVALKELSLRRLNDWKALEMFEREAKVLSQLNHPAIPRYLNYFQVDTPSDRQFYIVQELAEGKSLASLVENGWYASEREVKQIAEQILEILCYLQQLTPPVIHRDIKPSNIILRSPQPPLIRGERERGDLFLVDFGAVQDTYRHTMTGGSTVIGTYGYMAPEQFRGKADPATDLYGLAATLLFLLTHQSPADLPQRRLKIDFRSQVQISDRFADWLEIMLEPAIEDRFDAAKQALAALRGESRIAIHKPIQPAGSRITFKNTGKRLQVDILPVGWRFQNLSWLGFGLIWSGFLFFWTAGAIFVGANLFFPLFSIPFWVVGLGMLGGVLYSIAGKTHLEIDRESFRLQWHLWGLKREIRGKTADIYKVELTDNLQVNDRPIVSCTIVEGIRTHRFGSWLSQLEKEWLVEEITNFLQNIGIRSIPSAE